MKKFCILALFLFSIHFNLIAQNLSISSTGETGNSGINWSITGNTLTVSGPANIRASVIENHLNNTGPLTIVGNTTPSNLQVSVNEAINVSSGSNSLVIGASDNKGGITTTQTITLSGSISFHGGWVRLENNVETTGSGAKILAKANELVSPVNATDGFISLLSGKNLTTNGGDIILWSNATNRTAASGQANNEIILLGTNTLSTSGGKIVIAGGLDNGSNGGTASDGIPDGYAYRGSYGGRPIDIKASVTLNSGGGEIIIRGEQNGSDAAVGADATFTISNGGAVTIEGKNTTASSVALGTANITSTATNAPVTISGTTHITNSGLTTISTQGGDVLLASNVDDATDGESVTNGYIRMGSGLSVTTNGGDITIGGGDATGSGYALGSTASTAEGIRIDGSVNLNSGNGNIALRGKSDAVAVANEVGGGAIMFYNVLDGSINSGTGTLLLDGYSQTTGGNAIAGLLWWNNPTASSFTIQSANTTSSAITLNGYSTSSTGQSYGIEVEATNTLNVYATGTGGGININGGRSQSNTDSNEDRDIVFRGPVNILADSGPISIKGGQLGGVSNGYWFTTFQTQIGSKASTAVASSSSDITIAFDRFWFDANYFPKLATTGTVTIEPLSTGFGMGVSSSWFQYNQNSQTMTGLTLGKAGNTADINHEITAISVAGPIEVYGGTIGINADLTTTSGSGGDISLYTDNNLVLSSARAIEADGAFKLIPNGTSFSNNISYPITNLNLSSKGLTIGKSGNTADVNIMQAQTIAGPISVYGGNIGINENLNTSAGAADGDVLLKASGNNNLANGKSITTSGGDVTFWSDSDGNGTGYAQVGSSTAITTAGGNITLGGGSDIATGYARGAAERDAETDNTNFLHISGVHLKNSASLSSGGGNITLRGQNYPSSVLTIDFGVMGHNATLDAGSGKVAIIGKATGSGTSNTQAISVYGNGWTIRSSNSDADAIVLDGDGSDYSGNTTTLGINFAGIIESTGGGGIQLTGKSGTAAGYDHPLDIYGSILANSGTITITAENNDATQTGLFLSGATLGFKSATNVQASTSNIILKSDNTVFNSATNLNTTGAVSLLPLDASPSFGVAQTIGSNMVLSSGVSGLTIGKAGNTANVTISNAIDIAGPISVYGGTIALNADLATTNAGDISIYSDNPIAGLGTPRTLTAAGAFKYIPRSTAFTADVTYPITNLTATSTGLTVGKPTNDKNITINADVTGGTGIELYGNNVNINSNLKTTNGANMYLKGNAIIASTNYIESSGDFTHDGNLLFKSDATGTAAFGTLGGTFTSVSGSAITERYLPSKRGWRLLTAPLKGATNATIPANWQGVNDEGLLLFSPATYQSQTMTGYTTGGGMPNIWKYDSANTQWQSIPNLTTENLFTSTGNNGFLVFATGPSNSTNIASGSSETTLRPEGQLITGDVSHSLTADKYHLIGNPYASPLHIEAMVQANANTKVFMVDPTIGTVGGYVTYDGSNWAPTEPAINDKNIQSGQGFFVRSASNTTFTISESHKVIGNSNTWFERLGSSTSTSSSVMEDKLRVLLCKQVDSQWQLADGILTVNSATGNNDVDATDTGKMTNFNENIAFRNGTSNLSIEYRGLPTIGTIQPMRLTGTTAQPYQMRVRTENYSNSDLQPYLEDTQTGVLTLIPIDGSEVVVNFTGIAATTTAPDSRFRIVYPVTLSSDDPTASLSVGIYPNPVEDKIFTIVLPNQEETARYTLTNLLGQQVQGGELDRLQNAVSVASLQAGVYVVQVVQGSRGFSTKIIIK